MGAVRGHKVLPEEFSHDKQVASSKLRPGSERRLSKAPVRLADVATKAGVSAGTVSNVLNHPHKVSDDTAKKVRTVIEELGFVRDANASSLASGRSSYIGLSAINLGNSLFLDAARGAGAYCRERSLSVLMADSADDYAQQTASVEYFNEARVAGLLLAPMHDSSAQIKSLMDRGCPVVLMNYDPGHLGVCSAIIDNYQVGKLIAQHALELDAKHIAFVYSLEDVQPVKERRRGIQDVIREAGAGVIYEEIYTVDVNEGSGRETARQLISRTEGKRPDAVISVTDALAAGLIEELCDAGISVPGQIKVMGCDDNVLAADCRMTITTVRMHGYEMGKAAAEMLIDEILSGETHKHSQVVLQPELWVRMSSEERM